MSAHATWDRDQLGPPQTASVGDPARLHESQCGQRDTEGRTAEETAVAHMREWELEALARARARCPVTNHCFVGIKPVWTDDPYDEFGQCVFEATCLVDVIGPTCGPLARRICRHHRLEALEGDPFTHRPCGAYLIFVWFS